MDDAGYDFNDECDITKCETCKHNIVTTDKCGRTWYECDEIGCKYEGVEENV